MVGAWRCSEKQCRARNDYWVAYCPMCGTKGAMVPFHTVLPDDEPAVPPAPKRRFAPLKAAKPLEGKRIGTGFDSLDRVFGVSKLDSTKIGMHMPSVYLLAGPPGCGKTSLLLPIMAFLMQQGLYEFLFASSEQFVEEIRTNVIGMGLDDVLGDMNVIATRDLNEIIDQLQDTNIQVVFLDSINKLMDKRYDGRDPLMNKVISMERIVADANGCELVFESRTDEKTGKVLEERRPVPIPGATKRIYIVISHVNADDQIFGRIEMLHDVSGIMKVGFIEGAPKIRVVSCPTKNRWGEINVPAFFEMGPKGMQETDDPLKDLDPTSRVPLAVQLKRKGGAKP